MTPPPNLPAGMEMLTDDFLTRFIVPPGTLVKIDDHDWTPTSHVGIFLRKHWREENQYCAPLGTSAAATTPLPEPRCDCAYGRPPFVAFASTQDGCSPTCASRLRYRHILPGELAKMPTKPDGLLKASRGKNDWHEVATWPLIQRFVDGVYDFAYALPLPPQPEKGKGGEVDWSQSAAAKMERSGPPRAYSPFEDSMEHHESIAKGGSVAPPSPTAGEEELREETFTRHQVLSAIMAFIQFGEQTYECGHEGYFSGPGFAARALRWHLKQLQNQTDK